MRILIVEDEKLLADSIQTLLMKKGFEVDVAYDGEAGEEYACLGIYDLMILDVMMPKKNGYQVAEDLRKQHNGIPILMLTAKTETEDRIAGLNAGADYYLPKPFDNGELLACINSLLRRQGDQVDEIKVGNTRLNLLSATLISDTRSVRLSAREFEIMRLLFISGKNNIAKETILVKVWGFESDAVENHVEVYVGFLRKKLASINSNVRIESIRRLGYHLEVHEE